MERGRWKLRLRRRGRGRGKERDYEVLKVCFSFLCLGRDGPDEVRGVQRLRRLIWMGKWLVVVGMKLGLKLRILVWFFLSAISYFVGSLLKVPLSIFLHLMNEPQSELHKIEPLNKLSDSEKNNMSSPSHFLPFRKSTTQLNHLPPNHRDLESKATLIEATQAKLEAAEAREQDLLQRVLNYTSDRVSWELERKAMEEEREKFKKKEVEWVKEIEELRKKVGECETKHGQVK